MADHAHNLRAQYGRDRPFGVITRGTTGVNRLRRCDRWVRYHAGAQEVLRSTPRPLAIDVGYGASHTTTVEWARWLRQINPAVEVVGLEIHPERVLPPRDGVRFELGGFELAGYTPHLVRAFNVLRQYDVADVAPMWEAVTSRLAPGGLFIEGTCDELGRRAAWVLLDATGPRTLTLAWDPHDAQRPSDLAERLPKALIHNNVPGEAIHALLAAADEAWERAAGWAPHGPRVRWRHAHAELIREGWGLAPVRRRLRDNTLTINWEDVSPRDWDV
ncbi:SAM-dependent methyltransferase [Corynebacterium liangguodongii]|uniref:SAM-dependent methyltransferase n=1 Tax=Corynebacterium liangguodongii TaxID=2079535 RepID=A0A2S0WBY7_9CORY|nr:SAM-dependent methyltransferase [Corynebacterium liangguodongii]AWB83270.1 SAM-dependent methyltransferase [Corynebacterium liangguodongii]PWC00640.1 SAM-dependent methyltransferase [Corynebacterium liangguodongii]